MSELQTLLIVDDDHGIRKELAKFMQQHGYDILTAADGEQMLAVLEETTPDLIILDIMLPGEDGLSLCRRLRGTSDVPIVMLTAISEDVERILGLEMGADDYLSKPFNPRELLARVRAILRRSQVQTESEPVVSADLSEVYRFNQWLLNKTSRHLTSPDNLEISLSGGEFNLLVALVERPQQVLSRDQLLDLTRNRCAGPYDRSIDIQISRLRQKLEENPKKPELIKTVRGGGYVLATTVERIK